MDDKLTFDEESHIYRYDGKVVPSVTQILNVVYGISWKAEQFYLERGRAVHACAKLILQGLDFDYDPVIKPQVDAIREFVKVSGFVASAVEQPLYSPTGFAGTPDAVGTMGKIILIPDWKASVSKRDYLQLGFYSILTGVNHGLIVNIKADGGWKMGTITKLHEWRVKAAATLATYKIMRDDLEMEMTERKR